MKLLGLVSLLFLVTACGGKDDSVTRLKSQENTNTNTSGVECELLANSAKSGRYTLGQNLSFTLDANFEVLYVKWYGTRDGVKDLRGENFPIDKFDGPILPKSDGYFERYVIVKGVDGEVCDTSKSGGMVTVEIYGSGSKE